MDIVKGVDANQLKLLRRQRVQELLDQIKDSVVLDQYKNESNPEAHFLTTGPEIYHDTQGAITTAVLSVSTGGQALGIGKYLKSKIPKLCLVLVEPTGSKIFPSNKLANQISYYPAGSGLDYTPDNIKKLQQLDLIDVVYSVSDDQASMVLKILATTEGFLPGPSTGQSLYAALKELEKNSSQNIVIVDSDSGHSYPDFFDNYPKSEYLHSITTPLEIQQHLRQSTM